ncbi:HK97 family phage prohead protease [Rhodococcus pyridinivorans]|uniref:HK97 family phage prohead protease n=1 Tax=Rhodococcus pyridinivorans TaxID=103816 RepID=A0A7M2XPH3_9NOCA|nr:HK97 family phage prohead protease [Rhodococcus pyridinivorans]QOV99517.1 HK97 family phage prohead protease [Rhodococcus pyridinivorans]
MRTKDFAVSVKAAGEDDGLQAGQVKMLVSVFGNVDSYGDVVVKGAFAEDLAAWRAKGDPIPFIWSHEWRDPFAYLGKISPEDARETDDGLEVVATLDTSENTKAAQVYALLKNRMVTNASFAYDIEEAEWVKYEDESTGGTYHVYELRKLHLIEAGPCLIGANRETDLLAAKAAGDLQRVVGGVKAGRMLSAKNYEDLQTAHRAVGEVLASAAQQDNAKAGKDSVGVEPGNQSRDSDVGSGASRKSERSTQQRARLALLDL